MAKLRMAPVLRLAVLSLCVGLFAGFASAGTTPVVVPDGVANCVWLRVKVKSSGFEVPDGDAALGPRRSLKADCYMQLVYMTDAGHPHGRYGAPILCPVSLGATENWEATPMDESFSGIALGDGNVIAVDDYLTFKNIGGDVIQGYGTHRILISADKTTGAFKKATFQTLGAEMIDNSFSFLTFETVMGGYSASGSSVTADKVPQAAKDLVAASPCNMP